MTQNLIKKVQNGYEVDGLELLRKNCGCGGLTGPGGSGVGDCCFTYSTVKLEGNKVSFFSKGTTPNTTDNYEWGYRAKKDGVEVDVLIYDTRNKTDFEFGGSYAPPISAWKDRGWEIVDQFEKPLEGTGVQAPEWCKSPDYCVRPDIIFREEPAAVLKNRVKQ